MIILEALGAIFSIMGAYLTSLSSKENTRPLYWGFVSFFISNLALLTFFTLNGKVPVIIQMILFFVTAILGIYRLTMNRRRDVLLMTSALTIYISILIFQILPNMENIDFTVLIIDLIAASIAIFGSFILSSHNMLSVFHTHTIFICFVLSYGSICFLFIYKLKRLYEYYERRNRYFFREI